MNLQTRTETYKKYLNALNFQPSDVVCMWFKGDRNFFQSLDQLKTPHAVERLFTRNDNGQDIYISMASFQAGSTNRVKESVSSVRHVWVDADEHGLDVLERAKKDIAAGIIPNFSVVVESSPGRIQIIWAVDMDDFLVDGKPDIAKQEALNRALQQRYNTDAAVVDTARVLRVPGFINHKYDSKPIAQLLEIGDSTLWRMSDFKICPATPVIKKSVDPDTPIPVGQRNLTLASIAGSLRHLGLSGEDIEEQLLKINSARCTPPLSDSDVHTIAWSAGARYPAGHPENEIVLVGGVPAGSAKSPVVPAESSSVPEIDTAALADRPVFPYWVLDGTTLGEGFVKPVLASSSKHAEFLYLPAIQMMVNAMFGKVRMKHQTVNLNMFVGLVSPYGKFFKSTSCELAQEYFKEAGLAAVYSKKVTNADAKIIITGSGSPEGFGKLMSGLNCKHAVLYNDELAKFVAKAGIESSSFSADLLTFHGSGDFNNTVKSSKDSFAFEGGTYCFSWLWCTTDRGFNRLWPKLAGISTGLEDRMFFCICPETPKQNTQYQDPQFAAGAVETRKAVEAAVQQGTYDYEYLPAVQEALKDLDPRSMQLVQLLSLYFAVDMKETEISNEAVSRAKAMVEYRNAVAAYLAPIEALNEQARLQKEIKRELSRNRGQMRYRDLCRELHYEDYGSRVWNEAIDGLLRFGEVAKFEIATPGAKRKTGMIGLVKQD